METARRSKFIKQCGFNYIPLKNIGICFTHDLHVCTQHGVWPVNKLTVSCRYRPVVCLLFKCIFLHHSWPHSYVVHLMTWWRHALRWIFKGSDGWTNGRLINSLYSSMIQHWYSKFRWSPQEGLKLCVTQHAGSQLQLTWQKVQYAPLWLPLFS